MLLLFSVRLQRSKKCISKSKELNCVGLHSTEVSDYRGFFLHKKDKVLLNDILVRLERILDYTGVGLVQLYCIV